MRTQDYYILGRKVLAQRNFAFVVVALVLISNLLLAWKVWGDRDRIILVPQNDLSKKIVFDGKTISETYLVDWASSILSDLLTVNRHTVDKKNKLFLEISSTAELLKDTVKKNSERIKKDGVSTVFYPKEFSIDQQKKKVFVKGTFTAYFGRDKEPIVTDKTYVLGWRETGTGCLLVESLEGGEEE